MLLLVPSLATLVVFVSSRPTTQALFLPKRLLVVSCLFRAFRPFIFQLIMLSMATTVCSNFKNSCLNEVYDHCLNYSDVACLPQYCLLHHSQLHFVGYCYTYILIYLLLCVCHLDNLLPSPFSYVRIFYIPPLYA